MSSQVPIFINCRDRLASLVQLVSWLERAGQERIVLLDNDSSFPPLLDYLASTPHKVVRLEGNLGARALWTANLVPDEPFIYTDPDIVPVNDCPLDAIAHLQRLLDRHPGFHKAGLGLYLDDVPETLPSLEWERSLVAPGKQIEPGAFGSLIDTTFALHRPGSPFTYMAIRTGFPYQARHQSPAWYGGELSEEDRYYLARARTDAQYGSTWAKQCA